MIKVSYTQHAQDVMVERMISNELVETAVLNPEWKEGSETEVWSAFRHVGRKVLRVVVKGRKSPYMVITTYYDRRKK